MAAHHPIVYTRQDFVAEVDRITDGAKLPVVYDSVGTRHLPAVARLPSPARPDGQLSANASGPVDPIAPTLLAQKGSLFLTRPTLFNYIATRDELEQSRRRSCSTMVAFGQGARSRSASGSRSRMRRKRTAQLEARQTTGSTVLTV